MTHFSIYLCHDQISAWSLRPQQAEALKALFPGCTYTLCKSEAEYLADLPQADVTLTWFFRQDWFMLAPRLRCLSTPAAGRDYFQVVPPPSVTMLNGQFHGELMSETALGMLLGMCRGLLPAVTTYATLPWPRRELDARMRPLRGARVLILGFGHIGRQVGKKLHDLGAHVSGMKRNLAVAPPDWFAQGDDIFAPDELDMRLPHADHVILLLPSDTGTDLLLDRRRLSLLPAHATIYNLGRGNCLDHQALTEMLRAGRLAGACLDVFPQEPLPEDSPLRSCPNLWLFPHSSAIAPNYLDLYLLDFARQWAARQS
jgi:phosphoglycerate dehydrogenase-like enzyme